MHLNRKSLLCIILCIVVAISMFGCNESTQTESSRSDNPVANITDAATSSSPVIESTAETTPSAEIPTADATLEPTPEPTPVPTENSAPVNTKTPTKAPTKSPTKAPTKAPTVKPTATPQPTPTMTYEELVDYMMDEAQKVTDFMRANRFTYGDAKINPAHNWGALSVSAAIKPSEKIVSCDRLVDWILYRVGFTDQIYTQGMTVRSLVPWCQEHNFEKITSVYQLKPGDIVFVNPDSAGYAKHVFLCAGTRDSSGKYLRYDAGSNARITGTTGTEVTKGKQPFREHINNFMYAYRPCTDKMPTTDAKIYVKPSSTVAVPKSNAQEVYTIADRTWDGGASLYSLNHRYQPGTEYNQYEFHFNIESHPQSTDNNYWISCFVGARIPTIGYTPNANKGGIWVAFAGTTANIYFGPYNDLWNVRATSVNLPQSVTTSQNIIIVDSGDVIKYYHVTSSGVRSLLFSITLDAVNDKVVVWDKNNTVLYIGDAVFEDFGYFCAWNHLADSTISNMSIKGA